MQPVLQVEKSQKKEKIFNESGPLPVSKLIVHHSPVGVFGQRGGRTVGSQYGLVWILTSMRLFVIPDSRQCHHHVSRPSVSISTSHHPLSLMSWGFLTAFMAQARVTLSHAANSKRACSSTTRKAKQWIIQQPKWLTELIICILVPDKYILKCWLSAKKTVRLNNTGRQSQS